MNATTYNNPIAQTGTNANNNATVYASGTASNPNLLGVRDTLSKQFGIDNNRIGYNANNGNVQVDGQDVFKPSQNIDGTTYATQDEFNSIGGKLNALNNQYKLQQQATNPTGLNPYQNQVGDLLNQLKTMQTQGAPTMQDVYNSPQYAAAQAQQQLAAQQGINAAQEALGASGMARSSDLANDAQNVQNRANLYLQTQAAPAILSALQNQRQQQYSNVANLLNSLSSMNNQANQTALGQQNSAISLLNALNQQNYNNNMLNLDQNKFEYGKQQDAVTNAQNQQKIDESAREFAAQMGYNYDKLSQDQQQFMKDLAIKQQQTAIEGQNAATSAARLNYDMDPNNPMNQYHLAMANYRDNSTPAGNKNAMESQYLSNIDQMTPENRATFFKNEKANIVKDLGLSGYNSLVNQYNSDGTPLIPGESRY